MRYSRRTEEAYIAWIRRNILFHNKRHPLEMGAPEVTRLLTSLAVDGKVAGSTQTQALSALLFLYRFVLDIDLPGLDDVVRAKRPRRLPVVLARQEVQALLQPPRGVPRLMAYLLYGSGLRLLECCRLRVQDVDFAANHIVVRTGKGDKDRVTILPGAVKAALARHLEEVREQRLPRRTNRAFGQLGEAAMARRNGRDRQVCPIRRPNSSWANQDSGHETEHHGDGELA